MGKARENEIRDWQGFCRNDCGNAYFGYNHMLMQFSEDALNWKNGEPRNNRVDSPVPARKAYRDLKGRYFEKQIRYRVMF